MTEGMGRCPFFLLSDDEDDIIEVEDDVDVDVPPSAERRTHMQKRNRVRAQFHNGVCDMKRLCMAISTKPLSQQFRYYGRFLHLAEKQSKRIRLINEHQHNVDRVARQDRAAVEAERILQQKKEEELKRKQEAERVEAERKRKEEQDEEEADARGGLQCGVCLRTLVRGKLPFMNAECGHTICHGCETKLRNCPCPYCRKMGKWKTLYLPETMVAPTKDMAIM